MGQSAPQGSWASSLGASGYWMGGWQSAFTDSFGNAIATQDVAASQIFYSVTPTTGTSGAVTRNNWVVPTVGGSDARHLQNRGQTSRALGYLTNSGGLNTDVRLFFNLNRAFKGTISVYQIDYDTVARRQTCQILYAVPGGAFLTVTTESLNFAFNNGWWTSGTLDVPVGTQIEIIVLNSAGAGPVLSAVMFDRTLTRRSAPQTHNWMYVLTDVSGKTIGELTNADDRKLSLGVSKNPTASCSIPTSHRLAGHFFNPAEDTMMKVYRDSELLLNGPIVSSDDQPGQQGTNTITLNAAGPLWRHGFRVLGNPDSSGWATAMQALGWTTLSAGDLGWIARQMINYVPTAVDIPAGYGETGLKPGFWVPTTSGSAGPYWFKPVDQAVTEAASVYQALYTTATKPPASAINVGSGFDLWSNPTNVFTSDNVYATATPTPGNSGAYLMTSNYGFNIPADATIIGVWAQVERHASAVGQVNDNQVELMSRRGTGIKVNPFGVNYWGTVDAVQNYGGNTDTWGLNLTPADVNASSFGFNIIVQSNTPGAVAAIDQIQLLIVYQIGLGNFEYEVRAIEPQALAGPFPQIGIFNVYDKMGGSNPSAIFEYGTGRANLKGYGHTIDRSGLMTRGYIQQPAATDHSGTLTGKDVLAEATRGVYQGVVDDGGVEWDVLRQGLADMNVQIRKQGRRILRVTTVENSVPVPLVDFYLGDTIRSRICLNQTTVLDALLRVWGIDFSIDKQGNETADLMLTQT